MERVRTGTIEDLAWFMRRDPSSGVRWQAAVERTATGGRGSDTGAGRFDLGR
jgi:hypothetical protein